MTDRELRDVLKSRGATPDCPSCRRSSWMARPDAVISTKASPEDISAHVFICNGCGFMRLHAVELLTSQPAGLGLDNRGSGLAKESR